MEMLYKIRSTDWKGVKQDSTLIYLRNYKVDVAGDTGIMDHQLQVYLI